VATNGLEAIEALRAAPADVVVTDVNMPDMDGIEIVMALKDAATSVGLIVMSGGGLFGKGLLLDSAGALGADVTLEKPIDLDALRTAIDTLVARRAASADE
jgi:YesN/AraC family two-component response regulator